MHAFAKNAKDSIEQSLACFFFRQSEKQSTKSLNDKKCLLVRIEMANEQITPLYQIDDNCLESKPHSKFQYELAQNSLNPCKIHRTSVKLSDGNEVGAHHLHNISIVLHHCDSYRMRTHRER